LEIAKAAQEKLIKQNDLIRVTELAERFETLMAPHIRKVLAVEEPIEIGIEHIKVVGRVDAVVETEEGVELWELKTGKKRGYLDAFPLGVYALGIKEVLGKVPDRWVYVRLGQKEAEIYMGGEDMAVGIVEEAKKTVRKLLNLTLTDPNPGAWCRECPYRRWCSAIRAEPEPLPIHQRWLWSERCAL
jgi:CRISPR/Cas system-associated exonuclease Cas4 (RecB family)